MNSVTSIFIALFFTAGFSAEANMKMDKHQKTEEAKLISKFEILKRPVEKNGCGHAIVPTIDWKSFDSVKDEKKSTYKKSVAASCNITFPIRNVCKQFGVEEIKKIKKMNCVYKVSSAKKNTEKWDLKKDGETLTLYVDFQGSNKGQFVKKWLENHL